MKHVLRAATITVAIASALALGVPASAHEGDGVLAVESSVKDAQGAVRYVVRLTWENDGHPALDATVTAVAFGPAAGGATPVVMTAVDDDGRYEATIPTPGEGDWQVRFTSVTPTATIEAPGAQVPPPVEPTTTSTEPATTQPATTIAPSTTEATPSTTDTSTPTTPVSSNEDDSGSPLVIVAVVAAGIALAVGLTLVLRRRPDDAAKGS